MRLIFLAIIVLAFTGCNFSSDKNESLKSDSLNNGSDKNVGKEEIYNPPTFAVAFEENGVVMLFGKLSLHKQVVLIDNKERTLFETKTIRHSIGYHIDQYIRTDLESQPAKVQSRCIAYFGPKPKDYYVVLPEKVEKEKIKHADSLIKMTPYFDSLMYIKNQLYGPSKLDLPKSAKFNVENNEILIVTYYFEASAAGRFAILNNRVICLNRYDFCSEDDYYVFHMNNAFYIQTGTIGCGTGIYGLQIFEVTNSDIKEYYEEFGMSD